MKTWLRAFALAGLLSLSFAAMAFAQDLQTNVTYICNGERIVIDSCNIRDLSDTSQCRVGHPDTVMPNGLMKYTSESRGDLKKLLPTCKQPTAAELKHAQDFNSKVYGQQSGQQATAQNQAQPQPASLTPTQEFLAEAAQASQDPQTRAMNRCIAAGREPGACSDSARDKSLGKAAGALAGLLAPGSGPIVTNTNGPQMAGAFEGKSWRLEFDEDGGVLLSCAGMNSDPHAYQVAFVNNRSVVTITSAPKPIVLTMTNDGLLTGPAPVVVDGTLSNGSHMGYDDQGRTATVLDYLAVTRTCEQPILASKGVAPTKLNRLQNLAAGMLGGDRVTPPPAGVRMAGTYAVASGFSADFYPDSVVLGCGPDVARAYPYSVVADGSQVAMKVAAPHPLTAVLTILSGLPNQPGRPNPLGGQTYMLLRDNFSTVVAKSGATVPPGMGPLLAYGFACGIGSPDCQKILDSLRGEKASEARADSTGKGVLPGVPPGSYFLMISLVYNNQPLFWNFKVDLKPGANTVTLDTRNAVPAS